jgi:putative hydrolase of HD superfamily
MKSPTLGALLALQPLGDLPRTGWLQRGVVPAETIAAHVFGACQLVLALGPRVQPALDTQRCLALVLVHDAPEALLGDVPKSGARLLPAGAKRAAEERAAEELLAPLSEFALACFREHHAGTTREARFARVCDRLQLGVRLLGYRRAGWLGLEDFEETLRALDASEFTAADELRREILAELQRLARAGPEA